MCSSDLESEVSDDDDSLSQGMRHRTTIPWRSCGSYLSSAGLLLLALLLLSQLLKHSLMVAIDYWLAHWTSQVIAARAEASTHNCTVTQVWTSVPVAISSQFCCFFVFLYSSYLTFQ